MNKFCKECGKEVSEQHSHCRHCGTSLKGSPIKEESGEQNQPMTQAENQVTEEKVVQKQPMTKKNKVVLGSVITVIILLIGLHMWADNHFSYESVEKRFENAVKKEDIKQLTQLAMHEDGSSIGKHEAKAFSSLVKTGDKADLNDLTNVVLDGRFLGMYDSYKVEVVDQFATYDNFVEGLAFKFNEEEFPVFEQDDKHITYGPLAPGDYAMEAKFANDSGETSIEDTLIVASADGQSTWIDMDIPISMVSFYVENFYELDEMGPYIMINDEEFQISEDGETEEVGPFIIDGSQNVNVVVDMPWGEVWSDDIPVDESYMSIRAALIAKEDIEEVKEVLTNFGDEYIDARANQTTEKLIVVTDSFKEDFEDTLVNDSYYTGQFKELYVDMSSLSINLSSDTPGISVDAKYLISDSVHSLSESPELQEDEYIWNVKLVFDEEEWLISSLMYTNIWTDDSELDVIAGSDKVYAPSEETTEKTTKKDKASNVEEKMEEFMIKYGVASVDAINDREFEIVDKYITEKGPRREEAREYIDYLDSKDIYEEWIDTKLESLEEIDENSWEVTVIESIDIIKPDTSDEKTFRTVVVVKMINGKYYVDELIETNEI